MSNIRLSTHPEYAKNFNTSQLRTHFLIEDLFQKDAVQHTYTMHDRMIIMGIMPVDKVIDLPVLPDLTKSEFFLQRRELGIINVGGNGKVRIDDSEYDVNFRECLYIGMGSEKVSFSSDSSDLPAEFYINSLPAHSSYPAEKANLSDANQVSLGSEENCNERVIYQFIHENGVKSCQLVMGFTELKRGSIWNTFPPHTHLRRMETYFYFDLPDDQLVMHFMGEPNETRHIAVRNKQAVISPEWSIHSGAGTSAYSFIWGMGGENKAFDDMDGISLNDLL